MNLKINGFDILPFVEDNGIKWQRSDLDNSDAGRTMDGRMWRGRVATKIRLDITFLPMKDEDIKTILNLLLPEFVTVQYTDPMFGERVVTMYSNNITAGLSTIYNKEIGMWGSFTAPLIER